MFDAVRQWASQAEGDWRAHGTAYELVRVLTAPARRGLVRLQVEGGEHLPADGAAHLALTTGAPIVPVGIVGTDRVLPTGARLVRPFQRATITLGKPISGQRAGPDEEHQPGAASAHRPVHGRGRPPLR